MVEDLRKGTVDGIGFRDEHAEETIWLDLIGFVSEYQVVTFIIDVMYHKSIVHCVLLFLRNYKTCGNGHSELVKYPGRNITKISIRRSETSTDVRVSY